MGRRPAGVARTWRINACQSPLPEAVSRLPEGSPNSGREKLSAWLHGTMSEWSSRMAVNRIRLALGFYRK